jgi:hypothetical protein
MIFAPAAKQDVAGHRAVLGNFTEKATRCPFACNSEILPTRFPG